jgi:hypothetical protein
MEIGYGLACCLAPFIAVVYFVGWIMGATKPGPRRNDCDDETGISH